MLVPDYSFPSYETLHPPLHITLVRLGRLWVNDVPTTSLLLTFGLVDTCILSYVRRRTLARGTLLTNVAKALTVVWSGLVLKGRGFYARVVL